MEENIVLMRLRELCENNNFSFYRLAKESGVALSTISSLYTQNHFPSIPTLHKLCKGLNITLGDFFLLEPSPDTLTEEDRFIINRINNLSCEQKHYLKAYIEGLSSTE
ncbi:MAG: helix-turn-helix transcriptional regulator [Lachnospiraceae bacterium]|nr:helix-turn-helix transcriptional regulator [Lachnospiraceae bacterium]